MTPIARNPRLAFPSAMERARTQAKAYANIIRALNLMESTVELDSLLESDSEFRRNYHIIKENKEWYEDKVHTLPIEFSKLFKLPHEYFAEASHTPGDLEQVRYVVEKLAESEQLDEEEMQKTLCLERGERKRPEDPRCLVLPCFVNNIQFRTCVLDLGASKSVMPLDISIALGITGLEIARSSLVLADWSTLRLAGIARDIPVSFEGRTFHTDFLVLDTGRAGPGRIILGRPFLEDTNGSFLVRRGVVDFNMGTSDFCRFTRDYSGDSNGRMINISVARFFIFVGLETKKQASYLGWMTQLGTKHRVVALLEEYEQYKKNIARKNHDPGDTTQTGKITPNKGPTKDQLGSNGRYVDPGVSQYGGSRWKPKPEREEKRPVKEKPHWKKYLSVEWRVKEFTKGGRSSNGKTRDNTHVELDESEEGNLEEKPVIEGFKDDGGTKLDPGDKTPTELETTPPTEA